MLKACTAYARGPLARALAVCALALCALAPSPAHAEGTTVGMIVVRSTPFYDEAYKAFMAHMMQQGLSGRIEVLVQRPTADPIALANATRKLMAADVDVLVTFGAPATLTALEEHPGVPVLYAGVFSEDVAGINPANATGVCLRLPVDNLLRYVVAAAPEPLIAVLYNSLEEDSARQTAEAVRLTTRYGYRAEAIDLKRAVDVIPKLASQQARVFLITSSSTLSASYTSIMRIARNRKIATASLIWRAETPATITMTGKPAQHGTEVAEMVERLIVGREPLHRIKHACNSDYELIFNLREAQAFGLKIPMELVTEATKVIQ